MKLRLFLNTVRFRIQMPEVTELLQNGLISAVVSMGLTDKEKLIYEVKSNDIIQSPILSFYNSIVLLELPKPMVQKWAESSQVGVYHEFLADDGTVIKVIFEKDFKCLDDTLEDQSNMFPNPKETC